MILLFSCLFCYSLFTLVNQVRQSGGNAGFYSQLNHGTSLGVPSLCHKITTLLPIHWRLSGWNIDQRIQQQEDSSKEHLVSKQPVALLNTMLFRSLLCLSTNKSMSQVTLSLPFMLWFNLYQYFNQYFVLFNTVHIFTKILTYPVSLGYPEQVVPPILEGGIHKNLHNWILRFTRFCWLDHLLPVL